MQQRNLRRLAYNIFLIRTYISREEKKSFLLQKNEKKIWVYGQTLSGQSTWFLEMVGHGYFLWRSFFQKLNKQMSNLIGSFSKSFCIEDVISLSKLQIVGSAAQI